MSGGSEDDYCALAESNSWNITILYIIVVFQAIIGICLIFRENIAKCCKCCKDTSEIAYKAVETAKDFAGNQA